jgi:mono/diheme cytochrome c family protein
MTPSRAAIASLFFWLLLIAAPAHAADVEFFEKRIRPLFVEHCFQCHGENPSKVKGGLRLDTAAAIRKGGDSGALFVAGDPDKSLLIKAVRYADPDLQMPPKGKKLAPAQIADLERWVAGGAPLPPDVVMEADPIASARTNWAFRAPVKPPVPAVTNTAWVKSPIDAFVLAKIEAEARHRNLPLAPAEPADKRTLLRRATYDLTGLPPTPAEIAEFLADDSPGAFAKVVERLLASPRYGEKWGRHWLDVVRYTDSFDARGIGGEADVPEAWRYRDWMVEAFNRDLPYDQFILQQLAGDILATNVPGRFDTNALIATGVYVIGEWGTGDADKEKMLTDIVDDQIDVTGRGFLGLTLACARCHDHKFDPISTRDYYALAGIFFSSHILPSPGVKTAGSPVLRIPLAPPEVLARREQAEKRVAKLERELDRRAGAASFTAANRGEFNQPTLAAIHAPGADLPNAVANSGDEPIRFLTITLPGRSVALHPSPERNAAAVWLSPITGEVEVSGRVADADDKCGNGFEWTLYHGTNALTSGKVNNGQTELLTSTNLSVSRNDLVQLVVKPRGKDHSCDTTVVELRVQQRDATNEWRLPHDVVADLPKSANTGAWHFISFAGQPPTKLESALSPEERAAQESARGELAALRKELERKIPVAHGLREGGTPQSAHAGIRDARVHIRGKYDRLGDVVPRRFPTVLAGDEQPRLGTNTSGRLELARWIASPTNPLTARVMVNRLWQHHFGEGIVRTPNNFGKLGTPPTHPELLDWLAHRFVESGWSIKAMHRLLMLSATYQQSSRGCVAGDSRVETLDPENLSFARASRRRLTAEEIRDAMLFTGGELDMATGGPSVNDLNTRRRTLYVMTVRSDKSTYRMLFDAPDAQTMAEKRIDSTVAPQALFMLNHPFAAARASALSQRARKQAGDDAARVRWLYEALYSRLPSEAESALATRILTSSGDPETAWLRYCQVLLCANEFVYVD